MNDSDSQFNCGLATWLSGRARPGLATQTSPTRPPSQMNGCVLRKPVMPTDLHLAQMPAYVWRKLKVEGSNVMTMVALAMVLLAMTSAFGLQSYYYRQTLLHLDQSQKSQERVRLEQFAKLKAEINDWFMDANRTMARVTARRDEMTARIALEVGVPPTELKAILATGRMPDEAYPVLPDMAVPDGE